VATGRNPVGRPHHSQNVASALVVRPQATQRMTGPALASDTLGDGCTCGCTACSREAEAEPEPS
jgi:hypothetical protein